MKKLLSILGTVSLTATGASSVVANKQNIEILSKKIWKKKLILEGIEQLYDYNCVSTSVQMILNYYTIDINIYTQDRIHSDLGGRPGFGPMVSQATANYINNVIRQQNIYYYNQLGANYGSNDTELRLFQQYVVNSISLNAPLLFSYDPSPGDAYATVIYGINIDENPRNTQYYIMDPSNGSSTTINGRQLSNYLKLGGDIIGISNNFDFKNKIIKIPIIAEAKKEYTKEEQNFNVPVNLTQQTGIINYNQFHNDIATVEFPDWNWTNHWYGHNSEYHDYNFNAEDIPNDNDSWRCRDSYSSHWNELLWYSPIINNENVFLWDSTKTLYENDENNNFNITFQFKIIISFFSPSLITMADPDMPKEHLDFTTGNTIILKLK